MEAFLKAGGVKNKRKSKKSKDSADAPPSAKKSPAKGGKGGKGKGKGKAAATAATPVKEKKKRASRDPTKPVAPGNAFDLYVKEEVESEGRKEDMTGMFKKDVRALLKKEWDEMEGEEQKGE